MTSPHDIAMEHHRLSSRAELARQTLRLRAALHEAEEAERAEAAMDPASARAELSIRLSHLMEQRRQQLAADLAAERHGLDALLADARRRAADIVERAEQEFRLVEAAAREAAAREAAAREAAAREAAAREAAVRSERDLREVAPSDAAAPIVVLASDADLGPADHDDALWGPPGRQQATPTPRTSDVPRSALDDVPYLDAPFVAGPAPAPAPAASVPAKVTPPDPIKVEIDAEAFARVFGTMMMTFMRDGGMRHQNPVAPPPKASFWSNARHLDVLLIGVTMVIALLILAAWLV